MVASGYRDGFFTPFRMTGTGVHWQRSEESIKMIVALAGSDTADGSFTAFRMTDGFENTP